MEKFWRRVEKRDDAECWPWIGFRHISGYGHFKHQGGTYKSHRVAYALTFGGIEWSTGKQGARGLLVLHRCDNRCCCNPAHLFLGSQHDNVMDASRKRRFHQGREHYLAKLTDENVAEIKRMEYDGIIKRRGRGWFRKDPERSVSMKEIGLRYGVSSKTIEQVLARRAWIGIGEP